MSDNLAIIPHIATSNYSGQLPIRSHHKDIRSSSSRGTNISSSPKSASLIPYFPIPIPFSLIRSSKNTAIFYSKLIMKSIAGRVAKYSEAYPVDLKGKPQLNESEGGFEPDLNYFFPTEANAPHCALPLPFREGGRGVRSQGTFDIDSFRSRTAVNLRFLTSFTDHRITHSLITRFLIPHLNGYLSQQVGVEFESNCSRITVSPRFKANEPQASIANFGEVSRRRGHRLSTALGSSLPVPQFKRISAPLR